MSRHLAVGKPFAQVFRLMMVYDRVFRTLSGGFLDRILRHPCPVGNQLFFDISRHAQHFAKWPLMTRLLALGHYVSPACFQVGVSSVSGWVNTLLVGFSHLIRYQWSG
jgi:hypothetical protein